MMNSSRSSTVAIDFTLFPILAEIAQRYGYALSSHGDVNGRFQLIAAPWYAPTHPPAGLIRALVHRFQIHQANDTIQSVGPVIDAHQQQTWTIDFGYGAHLDVVVTQGTFSARPYIA